MERKWVALSVIIAIVLLAFLLAHYGLKALGIGAFLYALGGWTVLFAHPDDA